MRVAVTCDWFLKYASAQSAALARAGAEVLLLCRDHAEEFGGDLDERDAALTRASAAGARIALIPGRQSDPRTLPGLIPLRRLIRRFSPDLIHAHDGADPRALVLCAGWPTVVTVHDPAPHPGQPRPPRRKRWFLHGSRDTWRARAELIIVHSESLRAEIELRASQRCAVVPHGMDMLSEPLPPPSEPAVAFFGRLTPYKGLDALARAMPEVWAVRPDVQLRLAGGGSTELKLSDRRIHAEVGYLPEDALEPFFRRASVAVLPYTQASQTGAGSVAVGHGVPVIVSRVGGLPDLALDPSYIVEPGDVQGLADAIVRHVDDGPDVRQRLFTTVASPRSWDAVAAESIRVYEQLLAGR